MDLHIHDADMVRYLFGDPEGVSSIGTINEQGRISFITTVYRYKDGPAVSSSGGFVVPANFPFESNAFFNLERAAIKLGSDVTVYPDDGEPYQLETAPEDGHYWELKDFVSSVSEGRPSRIVTPEDAIASIELCQAELRSALERREVVLRS